jgi:AcrR family transcriptional regulator
MAGPVEERTRLAIETYALQLFVERGYGATTIDDIADRAKVAPAIILRHFQTKEAILLNTAPFTVREMSERLATRQADKFALSAYREWIAATIAEADRHEPGFEASVHARRTLRDRVIDAAPELRHHLSDAYASFEHELAAAVGADLGQAPDALMPRLAARTAVTGLRELVERAGAGRAPLPPSRLLVIIDAAIQFAEAGISAAR